MCFQVSIKNVKGSGRNGRVLKEDVLLYIQNLEVGKSPGSLSVDDPPSPAPPQITVEGQDIVQEIKGIKKAMVKSMAAAWVTIFQGIFHSFYKFHFITLHFCLVLDNTTFLIL